MPDGLRKVQRRPGKDADRPSHSIHGAAFWTRLTPAPLAHFTPMHLKLVSLLGMAIVLLLAWILSLDRKRFPWRTVWSGLLLQFAVALFILRTNVGEKIFNVAKEGINELNVCANEGANMVFGPLAQQGLLADKFGPANAFIFAVTVSATIIVISSLSTLLYHWGVLQRVVHGMAWVMQKCMRTTGSESLAAASNIFMGQTEAALVIKPYISRMTQSELMALMTAGMATIATGVMAVYGSEQIGINPGHLLTASVMSAPAALLISKIMLPELQQSETAASSSAAVERSTNNTTDPLC